MSAWDPLLYLRYGDERTRPARDLLAQVPIESARLIYDLGCGPGNSTALLARRFPGAEIVGLDASQDMLSRARATYPDIVFRQEDLRHWRPERPADLLFANAVFQWIPDHLAVFEGLLESLPQGGALAVQMPDNMGEPAKLAMVETAAKGPWAAKLTGARALRQPLPRADVYYDRLRPLCRSFDMWHTTYHHSLESPAAIVEWMTGSGLRPYLAALETAEKETFLAAYKAKVAAAYPRRSDGRVLLNFPRFFFIGVRG